MANHDAMRVALELRDTLREQGEYTQSEYRERLVVALQSFRQTVYEDAVDGIAAKVDRLATRGARPGAPGQQEMFDLCGDYALGDDHRIAKRYALFRHIVTHLDLVDRNAAAVAAAAKRERDEFDRLRPYLERGNTKAQAVAAWQADHPRSGGNT